MPTTKIAEKIKFSGNSSGYRNYCAVHWNRVPRQRNISHDTHAVEKQQQYPKLQTY
jgi:hypothetical protein